MSLKDIALPLIKRGISVVPARPGQRASTLLDWPSLATTNPAVIEQWDKEYSDWNLVCVPKYETIAILDIDDLKAAQQLGLPDIPATLTSKTPHGFHYFFLHTDKSRGLGNRDVKNNVGPIAEFKAHNKSVCAPGCRRDDGGFYKLIDESPLVPVPDALVEWIEKHSPKKKHEKRSVPVDPEFDFDVFLEHYGIEIVHVNGSWHSPRVCPVKGAAHTSITDCGFFYDGEFFAWKDHAASCDGAEMSIGQLIKHLNTQQEPYAGPIWPEREDVGGFGVDEVVGEEAPTREKCYRKNCTCGLEHGETSMAPEKRAALDKFLKEADEEEEEEEAGREQENPAPPSVISAEQFQEMISKEARFAAYVDSKPQEIPDHALYGQMGQWARAMELPLSIAYPAILTCYSALPKYDEILGVRFNLFTAILMPVGGGKNLALDRAVKILGLREGQDYMDATMGGAGGLFNAIGDKVEGKGKQKIEIPGPRKMLINAAEFAATMINCKLDNSTLAPHLCNLWDKNRISSPIQSGNREANCRVSILGALPIEKDAPEAFRKYFGEETGKGLHSRMILGYHDSKIDNRWAERWRYSPETNDVSDIVVATNPPERWSPEAQSYFSTMQLPNDVDGRALYNLKRVCFLTATANGDKVVSLDCLKSAEFFMLWQLQLKNFFRYGESERMTPGELSVTIMSALRRIAVEGKYERSLVIGGVLHINLARVVHNLHWEKYGVEAVQRTVASLIKLGQLQQGKKRNTKSKIVPSKHHVVVTDFPSE